MNNRLAALLILLLVLIVVAVVYFRTNPSNDVATTTNTAQTAKEIVKTEVDASKTPEKFPVDVPMEKGATITQNYNATAPDGRFQATRVFETKATLAENLAIYKAYLTKSGYEIKSTVDQANYKMVFGTKGNASLQISIDQNSVSKLKTVSISYTEQPDATKAKATPAQ